MTGVSPFLIHGHCAATQEDMEMPSRAGRFMLSGNTHLSGNSVDPMVD
jgi:hypothetical protein